MHPAMSRVWHSPRDLEPLPTWGAHFVDDSVKSNERNVVTASIASICTWYLKNCNTVSMQKRKNLKIFSVVVFASDSEIELRARQKNICSDATSFGITPLL